MRRKKRYEVQMKHPTYGWISVGNWPARTHSEGLDSLKECANGLDNKGSIYDHRLVWLDAIAISRIKARR